MISPPVSVGLWIDPTVAIVSSDQTNPFHSETSSVSAKRDHALRG